MVVIQLGCTARTKRLYYSYKLIVPAVQNRCTDDTENVYDRVPYFPGPESFQRGRGRAPIKYTRGCAYLDTPSCLSPLKGGDWGLYFTSSKTTLTDYQCVSTGCCTHVAKTEITIDNQHVTKSLQRYIFPSKQPKENT